MMSSAIARSRASVRHVVVASLVFVAAALFAACGGADNGTGNGSGSGSGSGSGAGGGTGTSRIIVTPGTQTLFVGGEQDFQGQAVDGKGTPLSPQPAITWSSSSSSIASVASSTGRVTGVAVGTSTLTATSGSMTGTANITVVLKPVASVSIAPAIVTITIGVPTPLDATLRSADGQVLTGRSCTWSPTDATVLSVSSGGGASATVTGLKNGTTIVTATCEGRSGTAIVTAQNVPVASIVISPDPAVVEVQKTLQLSASVRDANNNVLSRTVTWSSSAAGVASVNATTGLVTGVSTGTAEISATADGFTAKRTVTVGPKPIASITIEQSATKIYIGQDAIFIATAKAADGEVLRRGTFQWTVSNTTPLGPNMILSGPERATAQVFGYNAGYTNITATLEGKSKTVSLQVVAPTKLTLTTSGTGGGTLVADPALAGYHHEAVVRVTPTADAYSYFAGWSNGCSGTTIPCQVTMTYDRTVTGIFTVQPWVGTWGSSMTARRTYSDGAYCQWSVTFSSNSSVTVTYPRNNTSNQREVKVRVKTRITAPQGTTNASNRTCNPSDATYDQTLTGTPGTNGSFTVSGALGAVAITVTGSLSAARTVPGSISLKYAPSTDVGTGSSTASFTGQPTLQAPPSP